MKKIVSFLFLFLLVISFCACKKKAHKPIIVLKEEPIVQKTIIRFSIFGNEKRYNSIKKIVDDFEIINPDIEVEIDYWAENYYKNLNKSIITTKMPDVVMVDNIDGFPYYERGFLQNLNDYFVKQDDFIKSGINAFSYNDCIWGVPFFLSPSFIVYNKSIFIKNNLELPHNNWNITDFLKKAHLLNSTYVSGFGFDKKMKGWLPFLWSNGGGIIDESGCIMLDSAFSKEALQFYSNLKNLEGVTQQDLSVSPEILFRNEKIAMMTCDYEEFLKLKNDNLPFEIEIAPFPGWKTLSSSPLSVIGLSISQKTAHKRESWRFILYLINQDRIEKMGKSFDFLPARNKVIEKTLSQRYSNNDVAVFNNIIQNAKPIPVCSNYSIIINKIEQQLLPLFSAEKNVEEVIDENFYKILQKYVD